MVDLFKKYNLKKEKVTSWAKEHYPSVASGEGLADPLLNLMAQLYIREVMGELVEPTDIETITGSIVRVADVKEGDWCNIQVAVGRKIRETTYMGCPICFRSLPKEGPSECKVDGPVEPKAHTWARYIAADNSGEIMVSLPPRSTVEYPDLMGHIVKARGVLNDQGEFNMQSINVLAGASAGSKESVVLEEKAKEFVDEVEVQMFTNMLKTFPSMSQEDLNKWHAFQKVKTPLSVLLAKSGAEEFDEGTQKKYRFPRTEQSSDKS